MFELGTKQLTIFFFFLISISLYYYSFKILNYMKRIKSYFVFLLIIIFADFGFSQNVAHHVSNRGVYDFLDELANLKVIDLNSAIKPYSRNFIAGKLNETSKKLSELNKRQKQELEFYLKDFNKELKPNKNFKKRLDLFYYKDTLFTISINPILGIKYYNNESGTEYHRWNGAEAFAYMGKHIGVYANLRDNHESQIVGHPEYLTQHPGGNYKAMKGGGADYSEMRGGITYSWKWGSLGLVKDHIEWGNNFNGANIFSPRNPSFAYVKLKLKPVKWFDFNYFHGWLVSDVIDSSRSYNAGGSKQREVMHDKYIAANMYTITPFKKLNVSIGNSIVYSDIGIQPGYLIPFLFFKSVDHTYNSTNNYTGQNSQMFFDISSRQIKHLHIYTSFFIDEINFGEINSDSLSQNWFSGKFGFSLSNFPIQNLSFCAEYTRTNPITYKHFISTTTFETNNYNLGHYLKDNAEEIYLSLKYKPLANLYVKAAYTYARKGIDYEYIGDNEGTSFMTETIWKKKAFCLSSRYEVVNDAIVYLSYTYSDISGNALNNYTPELFKNNKNTFTFGVNLGF